MSNEQNTATQPVQQAVNVAAVNNTAQQAAPTDAVTADIQKLDAQITVLKADGSDIFVDAIKVLEAEKSALVAKAEAKVKETEEKLLPMKRRSGKSTEMKS